MPHSCTGSGLEVQKSPYWSRIYTTYSWYCRWAERDIPRGFFWHPTWCLMRSYALFWRIINKIWDTNCSYNGFFYLDILIKRQSELTNYIFMLYCYHLCSIDPIFDLLYQCILINPLRCCTTKFIDSCAMYWMIYEIWLSLLRYRLNDNDYIERVWLFLSL